MGAARLAVAGIGRENRRMLSIPDELLSKAYLAQNGEPAWSRRDALSVID